MIFAYATRQQPKATERATSHSLTHIHSLARSLNSHSLAHSHTHSLTHSHTHTHTHTHSLAHSLTHTNILFPCPTLFVVSVILFLHDLPPPQRQRDPQRTRLFVQREVELQASLNHPNIASLIHYRFETREHKPCAVQDCHFAYLVFEKLDSDLTQYPEHPETLSQHDLAQCTADLLHDVSSALWFVHRSGIIHR